MSEHFYIDSEEYVKVRLKDQIDWYSDKSTKNKNLYYLSQGTVLFLAASIPVLACFSHLHIHIAIIIGIIGALIVCIEGISKMCKYHENWIQYRYVSELLKHEHYLFITKTEPYDAQNENRYNLLVEKSERIISSENINWVGINDDKKS